LVLLNLGLAGLVVAMTLRSRLQFPAGAALVTGLVLYGLELRAILRARQRRVLDWGLRHFLVALALLVPTAGLGLTLAWPGLPATGLTTQLETVYGWLGLVGVVSLTVLGFLYKIVPFQVWYHAYARHVGRHRVPALADLYSERLQKIGFALVLGGVVGVAPAAALASTGGVRVAVLVLGLGLLVFAVNLGLVLRHFWRPRLEPLTPLRSAPPAAPASP
jgi:hypothetical protein